MLVTHAPIKPSLRRFIARSLEMDSAQPLVGFFLTGAGLRECNAGRDRGGSDRKC
jgi:hypothetical protein